MGRATTKIGLDLMAALVSAAVGFALDHFTTGKHGEVWPWIVAGGFFVVAFVLILLEPLGKLRRRGAPPPPPPPTRSVFADLDGGTDLNFDENYSTAEDFFRAKNVERLRARRNRHEPGGTGGTTARRWWRRK